MSLTVLSVAFPLATVGPDAVGGAEQVLAMLDDALVDAGHRSIVIAREGSHVRGTLVATPAEPGTVDAAAWARAHEAHRAAIHAALERWPIDVVHMHGVDFASYLPPEGPPVLATLHLPVSWYPPEVFQPTRPHTYLQCVSADQLARCPPSRALVGHVASGVRVEHLRLVRMKKARFALALGRICPEKGYHLAIDAAEAAGIPLLLAGQVHRHPEHLAYFESEILPRLGHKVRFIGPVGLARKARLLAAARCLLVPSLVPETSSLVAMEALACGTPVVAFRSGAVTEILEPGRTGFLVDSVAEMTDAIGAAALIDPELCRQAAQRRCSSRRAMASYLALYQQLALQASGGDRAA
jgi:glycosyltransferase involved in cell wall biosynthesis